MIASQQWAVMTASLTQLLQGPTARERAAGYWSMFTVAYGAWLLVTIASKT